MAKILLQDMVRGGLKKQTKLRPVKEEKIKEPEKEFFLKQKREIFIDPSDLYPKKREKYYLWVVAIISILFCFFAVSFLFASAKVTIEPKTKEIKLSKSFSAEKNVQEGLSFDLVVVEGTESKSINATEEKELSNKALGTVILYNKFSTTSQILSIDTRLEGSNGKIYKTEKRVVVPGMNKSGIPGSIEVGIYASEGGEEYNSEPLDFKILGFKGTPKYEKFYGRSKGPITGGFIGKTLVLSEEEKSLAVNSLKESLESKLQRKATAPGFILFKGATFFELDNIDVPLGAKDGEINVSVKGTLRGILLNTEMLNKKIAESSIEKYDGSDIYIPDLGKLNFTLSDKDNISLNDVKNINFSLSGLVNIVYKLDTEKFVSDLVGISKEDFSKISAKYVNIESATLKLRFPWMQNIPEDKEDIEVIVNYPK